MVYVLIAARIITSAVLFGAGVSKLVTGVDKFSIDIAGYRLLPEATTVFAAVSIIGAEILIGVAQLIGFAQPIPSLVASTLLLIFSLAVASVLLRGLDVSCGCFGERSKKVSSISLARNLVLMCVAITAIWAPGFIGSSTTELQQGRLRQNGIGAAVAIAVALLLIVARTIVGLYRITAESVHRNRITEPEAN